MSPARDRHNAPPSRHYLVTDRLTSHPAVCSVRSRWSWQAHPAVYLATWRELTGPLRHVPRTTPRFTPMSAQCG